MQERLRVQTDRGELLKAAKKFAIRVAGMMMGSCILLGLAPASARASASMETVAAQVQVGTLPLLAALGFGIAVAIGAVVAFLQMTIRGKEMYEPAAIANGEQESYAEEEWNEEEQGMNTDYAEDPLTDYTIPVTQILSYPIQAAPASDKEPRLCGVSGEHKGSSFRVSDHRLTFGRDPAHCAILFPYDAAEISRIHCVLRYIEEQDMFTLEDAGSSNGTFLATGERLQPGIRYELRSGERFSLSGQEHCFEVRTAVEDVV